ncbi:MAG: DUF2085 domain-containing protein [Chloroflexi bacterium]|nr:MAG: DUF2085 domain-containing protein [Chloroflexota bacterium]
MTVLTSSRFLFRRWLLIFGVLFGIFIVLPFLAPVFVYLGLEGPGKAIYTIYSFLCHQLPQRSFFLFGPKFTYTIPEILADSPGTTATLFSLRKYIGSPEMGWKVAWSDRMVSMYASTWLFAIFWGLFRKWMPKLPWWGLVLFLLPMAVDGTSHFISEITQSGFRMHNIWLVHLTGNSFSQSFYPGEAWGSFNSLARLASGLFFGIGVVWFGFPFLDTEFQYYARRPTKSRVSMEET